MSQPQNYSYRNRRKEFTDLYGDRACNILRRRAFSPVARQRHVRNDGFREWKPVQSPVKKPRVETYPYHEPERRPMATPAYKIPEPRAFNSAVIEKKSALFNPSASNAYPPLPQRQPVQKQPPRPAPQKPEPIKTFPQKPEPVKAFPQKPEPVKTFPQQPAPIKTFPQQPAPVKTVPQQPAPFKTVPQKMGPAKPPQQIQPVKSAQKPLAKQEANLAQKQPEARNPQPKSGLADKGGKAIQNKASESEATPVTPNADGLYQLDPLTAGVLEHELEQIMVQEGEEEAPRAPAPAPPAEFYVVNKFARVAGHDIKHALGLNVTKRLLNQHNPLYVKLVFSGKPEAGQLQAFIAAWRVAAFRRIASPGDTFAARLDAVADFDRLCHAKEVNCGSAKVTITPCYKFLECPPTVKSMYAVTNDETTEESDTSNSSWQKQRDAEETENTEAKTANVGNTVTSKDVSEKEVETKISEPQVDKTGEAKSEMPVKNTKVDSSPVTVNITIEAQSKSDEVTKNTSKEVPQVEAKTESTNKTGVNNKVTNQSNEVSKTKVKDSTEGTMVVDEHSENHEEMSDHDILALMSGGIVLDECSGSDDEK